MEAAEKQLAQTCRTSKIAAVIGSVYKVNGHVYDTAVVFNSRGELVERYGKVYLAGEKWATPGNHIAYFDLEGIPSSVMICHDERYPDLCAFRRSGCTDHLLYQRRIRTTRGEKAGALSRASDGASGRERGVHRSVNARRIPT